MKEDWIEAGNALQKTFRFKNFKEALAFVNKVGDIAEKIQHHPDICIRNYNTVFVSAATHDAGNIVTPKDRELAKAIEEIQTPV